MRTILVKTRRTEIIKDKGKEYVISYSKNDIRCFNSKGKLEFEYREAASKNC